MRTVGRVFVAAQDAGVGAQASLARAAESYGLEGVWVHGPASVHGDSYATTAAAAIASATTDLRVGVVLRLSAPDDVLRLAEDVAVLDHCSSGRAEICLDGRWADDPNWSADAERLMTNLRTCAVGDRQLAVTPGPLQPAIPAVAHGAALPIAGTGTVATLDEVAGTGFGDAPEGVAGRVVLHVPTGQTRAVIEAARGVDTLESSIEHLRNAVESNGAQDIVFVVPAGPDEAGEHIAVLACVVAPILRANEDEVADLVLDTLKFRRAVTPDP